MFASDVNFMLKFVYCVNLVLKFVSSVKFGLNFVWCVNLLLKFVIRNYYVKTLWLGYNYYVKIFLKTGPYKIDDTA